MGELTLHSICHQSSDGSSWAAIIVIPLIRYPLLILVRGVAAHQHVTGHFRRPTVLHHPEFSHLVDHDITVIGPPTDRGALPYFTEELVFVNLLPPELLCLLRVYTLHA